VKHQHITNIKKYAEQAERALTDIKGMVLLYRKHPNELALFELQQLVGELYTKTCAMLYESSMIGDEEINAAIEAKQ
jgi:hypothetical protein